MLFETYLIDDDSVVVVGCTSYIFSTIVVSTPNGQYLGCSTIALSERYEPFSDVAHFFLCFLGILPFSFVVDIHLSAITSVTAISDPLLRNLLRQRF